jgi:predicted SnoaL-like aldol condensation-catalyzing enzyme
LHINKVISYQNGWEQLQMSFPSVFEDIQETLKGLNVENLTNSKLSRPFSGARRKSEELPITPNSFSFTFDSLIQRLGWDSYRLRASERAGLSLYAKNLKDTVSCRLLSSDRMQQFPNWLFVETTRLYSNEVAKLSVLLVPNEDVRSLLESDRATFPLFTIERCFAQLNDLSPLKNEAPFVVLGFTTQAEFLVPEVIEIEADSSIADKNQTIIEKSIEFPPEHYQAGVGILSYFGEVLKAKHPESKSKVRIEQDGSIVRLHILSKNGEKEIIEKTLEEYTLVVADKAKPESLFSDQMQIMALSHKLEMAKMEVRQTQSMLLLSDEMNSGKVRSLEEEVAYMRTHIAKQLESSDHDKNTIQRLCHTQGEYINAQIVHQDKIIDSLIDQACYKSEVVLALNFIKEKLEKGVLESDEEELSHQMSIVADNAPELLPSLGEVLKSTIYGVTGNIAYQWFLKLGSLVP